MHKSMAPARLTNHSFKSRNVAVLIETDDSWGRTVMAGIAEYARLTGPWTMLVAPRDEQGRLRLPRGWRGDGVVVSLRDKAQTNHVRAAKVPTVDVSAVVTKEPWLARVITDDRRRAEMALEHLRDRGFERFGGFAKPSVALAARHHQTFASIAGDRNRISLRKSITKYRNCG